MSESGAQGPAGDQVDALFSLLDRRLQKQAAHSLEVDEDVFGRGLLSTEQAPSLLHLVMNVVETDSGSMFLAPQTCRLGITDSAQLANIYIICIT